VTGNTTPYTLNQILITSNIASGKGYKFRYRSSNVHGWSGFSPVTIILSATIPDAISTQPTTVADASTTDVTLSWDVPTNTGGSGVAISKYLIEVQTKVATVY